MQSENTAAGSTTVRFLDGAGEMSAAIIAHDWASTPLGPMDSWSPALRIALQAVLASPFPAMLIWGPELVTFHNDAYSPVLGDKPVVLGQSLLEQWSEVRDVIGPLAERALAGEACRFNDAEFTLNRSGRSEKAFFDFSFSPVRDEVGEIVGILNVCVEITARVQAEKRLRESENRYRQIVEGAEDFVIIRMDAHGIVTAWNSGAEYVTGHAEADMLGRPGDIIFTPEDRAAGAPDHEMSRAQSDRRALNERWHVRRDGSLFWGSGLMMRLDDGGYLKMFRDRTTEHNAEAALRLSETRLRELNATLESRVAEQTAERNMLATIVELTDVMVMAVDLDFNILALNAANADEFERIYGLRPKPGDNMLELLSDRPEHQEQVRVGWQQGMRGEQVTFVEDYGDPDRDRPFYEINFRPLRNEKGEQIGLYQFVTDVTERLRNEADLAEAREALRQAQKMEAVGQLTGGLAHDFNNLLAGMMGNLELLQARISQGRMDSVDRFIDAAQGAGRRAAALTQRLLAFSRRQTLDPKPTDIGRLVTGMEDLIRRSVGPTAEIEARSAADLWTALIDPSQLENALLNLCINGRDAMPEGGRVIIETTNIAVDDRTARKRDLPPGEYVALCVTDTGTGMTPEVISRAFDPFYTTKPIGQGTGLGLSMIYGFARQSGGQVRIRSTVGEGTTVCIYLPRHLGDAEDVAATKSASGLEVGKGETVLVIDDEQTIREMIHEVLEDQGYTVLTAPDGASGLKALEKAGPVDLLITDVGLPNGMNGRQVADVARVMRPGLKVLFVTGYADNAAVGAGHMEPGMALLTKPFSLADLAARVREMTDRR